jgi:hypothetical protein
MPPDSAVVKDLARRMVLAAAPEERYTFGSVSDRYLADPDGFGRGSRGSGRLGIDPTGVAVVLVAPVALAAASEVVKYVAETVVKSVVDRASEATRLRVRRVLRLAGGDPPDGEERVALTVEQRQQVYEIVINVARRARVAEDKAELMAAAVVGQLQLPRDDS